MTITKPGKSKQQLLKCLESLKSQFQNEIEEYNVEISEIEDGYKIAGEKKVLFVKFSVEVKLTAENEKFVLDYQTKNVPQSKINEALEKITQVLDNC